MVAGERFESGQSASLVSTLDSSLASIQIHQAIRPLVLDTFCPHLHDLLHAPAICLPVHPHLPAQRKHSMKRARQKHGGPGCRVEVSGAMGGRRGSDNPSIVILQIATIIYPQGGSP